jgi:hypothetical protein
MPRKAIPKKKKAAPAADAAALATAHGLVKQVAKILGPAPSLTVTDRKRTAKLRKGGETVIPTVATLAEQFGLKVASHPTDAMVTKAQRAHALLPLHKLLVATTKQVADQMFSANAESWQAATVHYSMLRRLARTNGDLESALTPVTQFFAHRSPEVVKEEDANRGHRKGAKAKPAAAPAPVTEHAAVETAATPATSATPVAHP